MTLSKKEQKAAFYRIALPAENPSFVNEFGLTTTDDKEEMRNMISRLIAEIGKLRAESQAKDTRIKELWTDADMINAYWAGLDGAMGSDHDTEDYSPTGGANKWLTEYKKQLTK